MTKSPKPAKTTFRPPSRGLILLTFIFRLLLLTVGGGIAWVIGIAVAQVYPAPNPEAPLIRKLLENTPQLKSRLPALSPPSSPTPAPTTTPLPPLDLSNTQREQLETQLKQLQSQLNTLIGQTTVLETQLGSSRPTETLEKRLELIAQQLSGSENLISESNNQPVASPDALPSNHGFIVTLPSDVLFATGNSILRPGSNIILDNLIAELENYQGATIQVGGHTDDQGQPAQNRELSLKQAEAVMLYLANILGNQYHWVAVGYGQTKPIVENTTDVNRQRNRRLEISIY